MALLVVFQWEHAASPCRRQPRRAQDLLNHWTCTVQLGIGWMTKILRKQSSVMSLTGWNKTRQEKRALGPHESPMRCLGRSPEIFYPGHEVKTFPSWRIFFQWNSWQTSNKALLLIFEESFLIAAETTALCFLGIISSLLTALTYPNDTGTMLVFIQLLKLVV